VFGDLVAPAAFAEAIDAVTTDAIADLVARMIGARRFAAAVLGPRAAADAASRFEHRLYA